MTNFGRTCCSCGAAATQSPEILFYVLGLPRTPPASVHLVVGCVVCDEHAKPEAFKWAAENAVPYVRRVTAGREPHDIDNPEIVFKALSDPTALIHRLEAAGATKH